MLGRLSSTLSFMLQIERGGRVIKRFLLGGTIPCEGRGSLDRTLLSSRFRVSVRRDLWLMGVMVACG